MKWKGRRESANVEDVRGQRSSGGGGGFGLLMIIGRMFGIKGIIIAAVIGLIAWKLGIVNPSMFMGGGTTATTSSGPVEASPEEQERFDFVKVVMADTEDVWTAEFERLGRRYVLPTMKVYRGQIRTGCGPGSASHGPFYCPADQTVYIDLSFYDELAHTFQSPGDFAQAYVIAASFSFGCARAGTRSSVA